MNIREKIKFLLCNLIIIIGVLALNQANAAEDSKTWMSNLSDDIRLCNVNIPGTHDSGTAKTTILTTSVASCQSDSISEQLKKGIRYLDIRINSNLLVNHGGVSCYKSTFYRLYLWDVLRDVANFLKSNPRETVMMQIREEGNGKDAKDFVKSVNSEFEKNKNAKDIYHSSKKFSEVTLGDVRGKIIVISSSDINGSYKYSGWGDNWEFREFNFGNSTAFIQDRYKAVTANEKMECIKNFYNNVWKNYAGQNVFYINFSSCVGPACPKLVAKDTNKSFEKFASDNKTKKFGIVLMDNPGKSLIETIYGSNKVQQ